MNVCPCCNGASSQAVTARSAASQPSSLILSSWLPISVLTDSYKTTHFVQYPEAQKMVAVSDTQLA